VSESIEEDVLQMFFKDREVNGDFISKASDMLWQREVLKVVDGDAGEPADTSQQAEQVEYYLVQSHHVCLFYWRLFH